MGNKNNIEIEIKVRVQDNMPLLNFLKQHGKFQFEKHQRDEYFTPHHRNFLKVKPVSEWLRLREEEGSYSLNYKNWHNSEDNKAYHCDEYEVGLDNLEKMRSILKVLDFESLIIVDKKRQTFIYKNYEIALDSVEELGNYVEVEYRGSEDVSDTKKIADEMKDFIETTGCQILEQDFVGYPFLLLKKKYGILQA